ncbi:MAG: HAD family hydrolase [Humidesulfovibrio sp.]|uniref:HAD family hydrolase n=1 Tax=Humidesulfovibrio sp. TaxID=2910988 RepID=UPI002732766A|nr:HAD family hydrolase [Humidesulfovibrio sp.]MDP2847099.1 HAD family hydrolase [Humidesulfovibrio sp.]
MSTAPRAIIFDLDGTLLDTLTDLADSGNAALAALGLPPHPEDAYRYFVGLGIEELVRRMLPEHRRDPATTQEAVALTSKEYKRRWKDKTRPYEGIPELLENLRQRGLPVCVLSNKPQVYTDLTVQEFFPGWPFAFVRGARPEVPNKPHPAGALALAKDLNLSPGSVLFVGDTATDMRTAHGAGMLPVGVLWGFRDEAELNDNGALQIIARPAELLALLDSPALLAGLARAAKPGA